MNPQESRIIPDASEDAPGGLPLERKLPLLILGLLTLVLATSLVVSYYALRRSAQMSAGTRLQTVTQVLAPMLAQQNATRMDALRRAARDTAIVNTLLAPTKPPSPAALRALSQITTPADTSTKPELWTADGRPLTPVHLEIADDLQRARDEVRLSDARRDSGHVGKLHLVGGHVSFWESVPIRQSDTVIGFIAQERRIGGNLRNAQSFRDLIGSDIGMFLRNDDDSLWVSVLGATSAAQPPARVERFSDSLDILTHQDGVEALSSTANVRGTPFLLTIEQPMDAALDGPRATIRVLAVIAVVLVVLGGILAWAISRQIARPLVELTSAAEAMAHGRYTQRVTPRTNGEIGRLGSAFNRMAEQVQVASDHSAAAVDQLTKSVATQHFLAEAGRILAMSLSDQILLTDLARYCVPTIADYCSIHVADDDGVLRRVESVHYDPSKQEALRALVGRYEYRLDGPGPVPDTIRTQQPLLAPRLDHLTVRAEASDDTTRALIDEILPTSFMCVPLVARGRSFGAMSFTMTDSGRVLGQADVDLAMELARRTAVAIDNALIYRRSVALRLEAEAASSAKSDFLAKMSHEIRTPINAMMGYAELLEMGISGPVSDAQSKQLGRIRMSGEHLTMLVNEILDLAKIEAGRMRVEPSNGVAGDAVEAALAMIRPLALTKGVELSAQIGGDRDVEYLGDPQRVQQVITNLLSNAVKFTPPGGAVSVVCGRGQRPGRPDAEGEDEWVWMTVEDNGVGIAAADLERVFDPFVQVDAGYTRSQGGTGLGLTISRGLAHMMSGEITVDSTPGVGSRFTLWLPVARFLHS